MLNVGIIGGGLAGLSAAIALKRAGHRVEVYERRGCEQDKGITLAIAPNAGRVYHRWGFDLKEMCGGVQAFQNRHVDGTTGHTIWRDSWDKLKQTYGSEVVFLRHQDLHTALLKHLEATEGVPATIHWDSDIVDLDCAIGRLYGADGSMIEKDMIVVCNGLSGRFTEAISGEWRPLQDTGLSFFRFLVPNTDITAGTACAELFEDQPSELCFLRNHKQGVSIVTYLCEGGLTRAVNVFSKHLTRNDLAPDRGARIGRQQLLDVFQGFHPNVQDLVRKAPEDRIFSWPLLIRDPIERYVNGRAVVLGDAAHTMKPQQGQGASLAIESVGCLEILAQEIVRDQVHERLELYQQLRLSRCGPIHVFSNMPLDPSGHAWMVEKIRPFWNDAASLPPQGSRPLSQPFRDIIYGYDVIAETMDATASRFPPV